VSSKYKFKKGDIVVANFEGNTYGITNKDAGEMEVINDQDEDGMIMLKVEGHDEKFDVEAEYFELVKPREISEEEQGDIDALETWAN